MSTTTQQLSPNERRFLGRLRDDYTDQGGWAVCKTNPPSAAVQGMVDRGYCRLALARCGPLGLATGEVMVGLTEAGAAALGASRPGS